MLTRYFIFSHIIQKFDTVQLNRLLESGVHSAWTGSSEISEIDIRRAISHQAQLLANA